MTDNDFWTLAMSKLDAFDDRALKEIIIDMAEQIAKQNAKCAHVEDAYLSGYVRDIDDFQKPDDDAIINCITDFTRLESVG